MQLFIFKKVPAEIDECFYLIFSKSFVLNKSHLFLQPNHKNFWCISSKIIHQSIINYQSLINKVLLFSTCKNFFHFNFHSLLFNAKKNSTHIQTSDKQDNSAKHANFQNIKFQINCSSFLFENCFNCNFYGIFFLNCTKV